MKEIVSAQNIAYAKGGRVFLKDTSFTLAAGKKHVLMGANGSGKSTVLDILSGSIKGYSGSLSFNLPKESVGYMSQHLAMPYLLTVKESIHFLSALLNPTSRLLNYRQKVSALHEGVQKLLSRCENQRSSLCSHGESKLILVSIFLVFGKKQLVLMDEPTSGLSEESRKIFVSIVDDAVKRGVGVLYSTHIVGDVKEEDIVISL